jgi:hypothetical protein
MVRYGPLRSVVNHFLKWAFSEAANAIGVNRVRLGDCHVVRLYERIRHRKGHATAIGAVARHLAEATYWMWTRQEGYRQPQGPKAPSRKA